MTDLIEIADFKALAGKARLVEANLGDDIAAFVATFEAGHIPGALIAPRLVWAREPEAGEGRNPLPRPEILQKDLRALGLALDAPIVLYDRFKNVYATRAAWVLRNAGFTDVKVLNGGFSLWQKRGEPVEAGKARVATPSEVTIAWGRLPKIEAAEVLAFPATGILIDARNADRYAGLPDPKDPRPGHVPGARNLPWESLYDDEGRFRDPAELRAIFKGIGVTGDKPLAAYCGSGISATYILTALARAGLPAAALYPGSWSEWAANPDLPVTREPA